MFIAFLAAAYNFLFESVINDGNLCFDFLLKFWVNIARMANLAPDI